MYFCTIYGRGKLTFEQIFRRFHKSYKMLQTDVTTYLEQAPPCFVDVCQMAPQGLRGGMNSMSAG